MPHPEHSPRPVDDTTFLAAYERAWQRFHQAEPTATAPARRGSDRVAPGRAVEAVEREDPATMTDWL
jgi:hypothetical protein